MFGYFNIYEKLDKTINCLTFINYGILKGEGRKITRVCRLASSFFFSCLYIYRSSYRDFICAVTVEFEKILWCICLNCQRNLQRGTSGYFLLNDSVLLDEILGHF